MFGESTQTCFGYGLSQGEVVGCIVWWVGLPSQVITIQSIAFPEELTAHF